MDINNNSLLGTLRIMLLKGEKGDKGDAGVSGDYSGLSNKPKINNVTVDGNMSGTDLGLPTIAQMVSAIYPVGSVYISVNDNDPSVLFGGTWVRIKDTFLLASGDTYENGSTGGEAAHTLNLSEIPSHYHDVGMSYDSVKAGTGTTKQFLVLTEGQLSPYGYCTDYTGGGNAHNNMPPYLTVYMWRRTA